jgi:mRNA-degrading endonuclease RelE of RelBE toxin-antitoxin system
VRRCGAKLEGLRSARRGAYRIINEVDDDNVTVTVSRIDHRLAGSGTHG